MSAVFFLGPQNVLLHSSRQAIHAPAILSGVVTGTSSVFTGLGLTSVVVTMNVTGAVTGTSLSLVLTLEELDPGDLTTILQTVSAAAITATLSTRTLRMNLKYGDAVRVKWAITGTSPVFNGVYTTLTVGQPRLPYLGTQVTAESIAVNIASDQVVPVKSEVQIDYNTGVTTQNLSVMGIALPSAAGAVAGGTSTNPVRTDPTGTTAQPASQGAAGTAAAAWFGKITDGTNIATVKAASTAAAAADSALVVAISPNNTVPINIASWVGGSTAPTVGLKALASSIPVGLPSDQVPNVIGQAWFSKTTDGTNTAAVKAASTAAVAADPAVVVTLSPNLGAVGQKAMSSSVPVTLANDQFSEVVSGSFGALNDALTITNLAGKRSVGFQLRQNSSLNGTLSAQITFDGTNWFSTNFVTLQVPGTRANSYACTSAGGSQYFWLEMVGGAIQMRVIMTAYTSGTSGTCRLNASDAPELTKVWVDQWLGSTAPSVGQKTGVNSIPVVIASDQAGIKVWDGTNLQPAGDVAARARFNKLTDGTNTAAVKAASTAAVAADPAVVVAVSPNSTVSQRQTPATTAALANVVGSATSVQLLAANANRFRAYIYNDSAAALTLKYGTTASTTSLTTIVAPNAMWPVDDGYTGRIDGIWASAVGNARVTELTA
jgi:hypothetical protein